MDKRILIIDDQVDFLDSLQAKTDVIENAIIYTANSMEEALDFMKQPVYDIIVCDLNIAGKFEDGVMLYNKYNDFAFNVGRQSFTCKKAYWVFISGNGHELEKRVTNFDYSTFLTKPFDPDRLIEVIRGYFNKEKFEQLDLRMDSIVDSLLKLSSSVSDISEKVDCVIGNGAAIDEVLEILKKDKEDTSDEVEFTTWLSSLKRFLTNVYVKYLFWAILSGALYFGGRASMAVDKNGNIKMKVEKQEKK